MLIYNNNNNRIQYTIYNNNGYNNNNNAKIQYTIYNNNGYNNNEIQSNNNNNDIQ